jgi:hypothetical protein
MDEDENARSPPPWHREPLPSDEHARSQPAIIGGSQILPRENLYIGSLMSKVPASGMASFSPQMCPRPDYTPMRNAVLWDALVSFLRFNFLTACFAVATIPLYTAAAEASWWRDWWLVLSATLPLPSWICTFPLSPPPPLRCTLEWRHDATSTHTCPDPTPTPNL